VGKGKQHAAEYRVLVKMLRDLRVAAEITQSDLAARFGRPQSYISKIERGERIIDPVELRWICRELDVDAKEVMQTWEKRIGSRRLGGGKTDR
jgi:transcriptional regulator with XRE-family HTH domain